MSGSSRLKAEEKTTDARVAILQAGIELLVSGVPVRDPLGVELSQAIAQAGVPKSTGYRLFSDPDSGVSPQLTFAGQLAAELFDNRAIIGPKELEAIAMTVMVDYPDDIAETGTPAELASLFREIIRVVGAGVVHVFRHNRVFWGYISACTAVGSAESDRRSTNPVAAALTQGDANDEFLDWYRKLWEMMGLRLKPGWDWNQFDGAVSSAAIGTAVRASFHPHLDGVMRPTGPGGELQEWSTAAVLMEGFVLASSEPNPRVRNAADLSLWLL